MPTARESLLEAAREAIEQRPWPVVRMVEVAAAAGVSRQTLYNEFGDKAGLGSALVERQVGTFLDRFTAGLASLAEPFADAPPGVDDGVTGDVNDGGAGRVDGADGADRTATALTQATRWMADWVVRSARRDRLVRATLTGCQSSHLPPCAADPGQLVAELCHRAMRVLTSGTAGEHVEAGELAHRCETAIRLALSHVVAPAPEGYRAPPESLLPESLPRAAWHLPEPEQPLAAEPSPTAHPSQVVQSPSRRSRVASSRRSE